MKIFIKQQSANGLIFSRPTHLLIAKLANLLIFLLIFIACSKNDDDEPVAPPTTQIETPEHLKGWTPQPKVDTKQPYMAFATGSTSATTLSLTAVGATATDVWVDTNNNGVFDEGVDKRITDFTKPISFTAASGVFTIYGKVKELTANGNALTAADVRSNEALTKLNVANNQLSEKAMLNLLAHLPKATATGTTAVVLRNTGDPNEKNVVTDAVLGAAKERGWQALKIEDSKEVTDLPTDTEVPTPATMNEKITVTDQTATLSWETAKDNQTSFDDLRYQVFWKAQGSTEEKNSGTPKAAMFHYTIEGLTASTSYTVWVEVSDKASNKAQYPEKTFTTAKKEEPKPEPKDTHYIVLTTEKAIGKEISLYIGADKEDREGVWLDLNGNGKWDEGIDRKPKFGYGDYTLKAQTFKIYGKVNSLNCRNNLLTAIDISHNPALTELFAEKNNLPSIAHLEQLKELGIDTHTLLASSLPKGLTYLTINETESAPLTTIDTNPFTELIVLDITHCKSIKSLDLSHNKKLSRFYAYGTGLTELDLSHQPELTVLNASNTSLTKINIAGNKALKYVELYLTEEGEGLQGEALMDFLQQLPTREKDKEGKIYLSPAQATEGVKSYLESKHWKVNPKN